MVVISFVNNKGGVGKTTLCCNLAQALAIVGQKVLCIDTDGQHNLSGMLGLSVADVTIRDLYQLKDLSTVDSVLSNAILESTVPGLHCITAPDSLSDADVTNERILAEAIPRSFIPSFYDFVIFDNHPGISLLQRASLHPAQFVFIPTELQQLAVNGLSVMFRFLTEVFSFTPENIRIIPNKYRDVNRQNNFIETINRLFPGSVTETPIPLDNTFDELVTEGKILFLDRFMSSKAVPYFVKLMVELFPFSSDKLSENIMQQRNKHLSENARNRLQQIQKKESA
ncbi:MAG: ParA family protein [Smithella sp.]|nr:ParA family protein [Smithella sp.]